LQAVRAVCFNTASLALLLSGGPPRQKQEVALLRSFHTWLTSSCSTRPHL